MQLSLNESTKQLLFYPGAMRTSKQARFCFIRAQSVCSRSTQGSGIVGADITLWRVPAAWLLERATKL